METVEEVVLDPGLPDPLRLSVHILACPGRFPNFDGCSAMPGVIDPADKPQLGNPDVGAVNGVWDVLTVRKRVREDLTHCLTVDYGFDGRGVVVSDSHSTGMAQ